MSNIHNEMRVWRKHLRDSADSPTIYYHIYFGVNQGQAGFSKCGITGNLHKRLSDYETWARKNDLCCWLGLCFHFRTRAEAYEYEQEILGDWARNTCAVCFEFGLENCSHVESFGHPNFPHPTECFDADYQAEVPSNAIEIDWVTNPDGEITNDHCFCLFLKDDDHEKHCFAIS